MSHFYQIKERCVYEHWYKGKCFYVGSGNLERPYKFGDDVRIKSSWNSRNINWWKYCDGNLDEIEVRIVLIKICSRQEIFKLEEQRTIELLEAGEPLTNIKKGDRMIVPRAGKLAPRYGAKLSEETKKKISESHKGKKLSKEARENLKNKYATGELIPSFLGRKHTDETKLLIGSKSRGRKHTEETKKIISQRFKGIPKTKEHNLKNSLASKRASKVTCIKISNNDIYEFRNLKLASEFLNIGYSNLRKLTSNNKTKEINGFLVSRTTLKNNKKDN